MDDGMSWLALLSKREREIRSEYILDLYENGGQYNVCHNCRHHMDHDVSGCTMGFVIGHMCEFSSRFYKFEKEEIIVDELRDDPKKKYRRIKMKPLWAVIAQSIGKKLNESFIWEKGIYKILDDGLYFWDEKKIEWQLSSRTLELLGGQGSIGTVGETCHKCGRDIKVLPVDIIFCPYCGERAIWTKTENISNVII